MRRHLTIQLPRWGIVLGVVIGISVLLAITVWATGQPGLPSPYQTAAQKQAQIQQNLAQGNRRRQLTARAKADARADEYAGHVMSERPGDAGHPYESTKGLHWHPQFSGEQQRDRRAKRGHAVLLRRRCGRAGVEPTAGYADRCPHGPRSLRRRCPGHDDELLPHAIPAGRADPDAGERQHGDIHNRRGRQRVL